MKVLFTCLFMFLASCPAFGAENHFPPACRLPWDGEDFPASSPALEGENNFLPTCRLPWDGVNFPASDPTLEGKKNFTTREFCKNPPLIMAINRGASLDSIKALVKANGASIAERAWSGNTPLSEAARQGSLELVSFLYAEEAKLPEKVTEPIDLLQNAVLSRHAGVVRFLLELEKGLMKKHINPDAAMGGETLLHLAAGVGSLEIAELLIGYGVDINQKDDEERTPLDIAVQYGFADLANYLILSGANTDTKTPNRKTAAVARNKRQAAMMAALKHCADFATLFSPVTPVTPVTPVSPACSQHSDTASVSQEEVLPCFEDSYKTPTDQAIPAFSASCNSESAFLTPRGRG